MSMENLIGKRFGKLVVTSQAKRGRWGSMWAVRCDCGASKVVLGSNIRHGKTMSCGCLQKQATKKASTTHGKLCTKEWNAWNSAKQRCCNPNLRNFHNYGGRGIKMCLRWLSSPEVFLDDMGKCPANFSLDRIDPNGNYEPSNCRWADINTQANNRRTNHRLTLNGVTKSITQWSEVLGLSLGAIKGRIKRGWTTERALTPLPQ